MYIYKVILKFHIKWSILNDTYQNTLKSLNKRQNNFWDNTMFVM